MENKVRILVIGAGPAGLSTLKALKCLESDEKYQVVCVEKQDEWGGQWNFSIKTGVDQYGEPIHSGMYSELWTNTPKQCFQFGDYTYKDHFGKSVPAYLPRDLFKGYFMKRFQKQGIHRMIKFSHIAKNVKFLEEKRKFEATIKNLRENSQEVELFDFVIVSTGHYSTPNIPDLKGQQNFKGVKIHSHDVRKFTDFKDKNILVIGGFLSAEDMTLQSYKYGAKHITWTFRQLKIPYDTKLFPKNIELIHGFSHLDGHFAHFLNGEKREIDYILCGTGYIHAYPFLEQNLKLKTTNNIMWHQGLFKGIVWQKNPQLIYIGMGNYEMCQTTFDIQAYLARDIITGKFVIPDLKQRDPGDLRRIQQMKSKKQYIDVMKSICGYLKQLIELTDYPRFDPHDFIPIFLQMLQIRVDNLLEYRDIGTFKSIFTGQESCLGNKKWIDVKQVEENDPKGKQQLAQFFQFW